MLEEAALVELAKVLDLAIWTAACYGPLALEQAMGCDSLLPRLPEKTLMSISVLDFSL